MSNLLKNIIRFAIFILLQAYVLNKIPSVHQFAKPYLYFLFILWLPFNISRSLLLIIAFLYGLVMDYFSGTPGLHAAACTFIAYARPFILTILLPQETTELSYNEPNIRSLGTTPYAIYVLVLTFLHHTLLVFIEWMQFADFLFFMGKVAATTLLSLVIIFITELIFSRKARYRTNAA